MEWLEPWCSTSHLEEEDQEIFCRQLQFEVTPGHCLYGLPVRLLARGMGDDALFQLLDGSGRVAGVHLVWSKRPEVPPWPITIIYASLSAWFHDIMLPEHEEWRDD